MATIVRLPDLPVVPVEDGDTVAAYRDGKVVRIPAGGGGGDLPDLATVAFTGMYSDLLGLPTLGSAASMSASAFATAAQGALADSSLQPADIGATIQAYSAILSGTTASFTTALKTKLDDIQAGATANATDSYLLNRANHTGTQPASTITGLATVATTGSYNDLSNSPALGTAAAANIGDFATAAQGAKADTALQPAAIGVTVQGYSAVLNDTTASFTTALKTKLDGIAAGATANTGTVTSVQVAVPTGLQASGGPVTSSGTITISYASGYAIPTTEKQSQWDTAYSWGNHAAAGYVTPASMAAYTYDKATIDSKIDAGGVTAAEIKTLYESNPNTNAFTDSEKAKLSAAGTNANGNKTISTNPPSGTSPGDVWYQVES